MQKYEQHANENMICINVSMFQCLYLNKLKLFDLFCSVRFIKTRIVSKTITY